MVLMAVTCSRNWATAVLLPLTARPTLRIAVSTAVIDWPISPAAPLRVLTTSLSRSLTDSTSCRCETSRQLAWKAMIWPAGSRTATNSRAKVTRPTAMS
ncbi:hypothetical protein GALL_488940 [mine drainage metagenome]|uniref:Uncharacterized protein n=1 Tax=mine drainage metagenome TaxID=410659 RepID=A0A1J5PW25_9ZZZZ